MSTTTHDPRPRAYVHADRIDIPETGEILVPADGQTAQDLMDVLDLSAFLIVDERTAEPLPGHEDEYRGTICAHCRETIERRLSATQWDALQSGATSTGPVVPRGPWVHVQGEGDRDSRTSCGSVPRFYFHPHTDSAGNIKPGDVGSVLDLHGTIVLPSTTYTGAVSRLGTVHRTHEDVPVVVESCRCCGEHPPAEGRTMCDDCCASGCHPDWYCSRPPTD